VTDDPKPEVPAGLWDPGSPEARTAAEQGIHCLPIPTPFAVGRVNTYLIEDDPLTLLDAGPNSGRALDELEQGLAALGHRVEDLELILVSHQHMLSIPMFALVVSILFMLTRLPARVRASLGPVPMVALLFDFGGWWLARLWPPSIYFIAMAGLAFGLIFGFQILTVVVDLWRPRARPKLTP
jgi:hypothetical protein